MRVYIARVSRPVRDVLAWHDGHDMEMPYEALGWLRLSIIEYHGRCKPWTDADAIYLRVAE